MKKQSNKVETRPVHRRRTVFPLRVDFHGWWMRSKKGLVAQLVNDGRDRHDSHLYRLMYAESDGFPQTLGEGRYTTEDMIDHGMFIYLTKAEAIHGDGKAITLGSGKTID